MDNKPMLDFLCDLKEHNTLEWMHAHKDRYHAALGDFTALVQALIFRLAEAEPALASLRAEDLLFRLNRDTRFSRDKSPYHPAFRAHISPAGKAPIPVGYYLSVAPGAIFLGGGLFAPQFTDATRMVRDYVAVHGGELEAILTDPAFARHLSMTGEKLKGVPRGYDRESPWGEYLKHKTWAIEDFIGESDFLDRERFLDLATARFQLMRPFNAFFNRALANFTMPRR